MVVRTEKRISRVCVCVFLENESDFSDNVSIDSDHSSNSYRAFDKTTIGRVNKSIYQLDKTLNQPTLEHLKFYYTNANSLNNKMSSLDALASTSNPTIIAISETWFNQNSNTHLHGYSPILKNRNGHGGGVALYISEEIESFEIHNQELENQEVEQIWCGIRVGDEKFLIGCVYRPPPKQAEEKVTRNDLELALIRSIKSAASEVSTGRFDGLCVFGDFKFTKLAWYEDGTTHISGGLSPDRNFFDTLNEHYLHQLVNFPTFSNAKGQRINFLDLVISNSSDRVFNIEPGPPLSDDCVQYHVSITGSVGLSHPYQKRTFVRSSFNYKKADFRNLSKEFERIDWSEKFRDQNTNECYDIFVTEYNRACDLWIPKKTVASLKVQPPWMTGSLAKLIAKKKRLWILVQQTGAKVKSLVDEYKLTRNEIKKLPNAL